MGALGAVLGLGGSIFSGIGSIISANKQADAIRAASAVQKQIADKQLGFQENVWNTTQSNQAPFLKAGQSAIGTLSQMYGNGGPQWTQTFTAPTNVTEQNDPGYQLRLQQGQQALERSAAARGNLLSGGTGKAEQRYAQDYASNEYNNVYNRALNTYGTNYNTFQQNAANIYNRLAGIAGTGQVSANQLAGSGAAAANTNAATLGNFSNAQSQALTNLGTAQASGYAGLTNAVGGGLSNLSNLLYLKNILGSSGASGNVDPGGG